MSEVTVREELLEQVEEVENVFIPLPDGIRLAARLFLPRTDGAPSPVILEYLPYRKRDFMRARDEPMHRYFAAHGYAVARVDVRGSGDSDGAMTDEYSVAEIDDALHVIAWLAAQSWCDGNVGMMGISWGGFNSLQVAARRPPALKAIITLCASDDRYADDAHYMGGCLLNENMQWGSILMTYQAMPPDPEIVGERWRAMWRERLEKLVAFPAHWLRHPNRDEPWKHGSVCEDYADITCPVYAVGGWADGYSNAVFRLLAGLSVPRKGLVGPWAHTFPHHGYPGPKIGFLQEAIRWWDQWLRGRQTGIMEEPMLRVWMQESIAPAPEYDHRPGRWVAEPSWPANDIVARSFFLEGRGLVERPSPVVDDAPRVVRSPQTTGVVSGEWCAFGARGEMPLDQRVDDGRSLVFDGPVLERGFEILGAPVLELELASDEPWAMLAVRLCEVAPGGASTRVTYGLLNLAHREGHAVERPLVADQPTRVRIALNDIAHAFSAGHRVRLALSTAYWPIAWPSRRAVKMTVWPKRSRLSLPVRVPKPSDAELTTFPSPEEAPGIQHQPIRALPFRRTVERDLTTDTFTYTLTSDGGEFGDHSLARLEPLDLTLGYAFSKTHRIRPHDPLTAETAVHQWVELSRQRWNCRVECETSLAADEDHFRFRARLRATEGMAPFVERHWDEEIPRRGL
ncbi:MAG: CocE/NonD family hydrolase [Myxococcota bacterium]